VLARLSDKRTCPTRSRPIRPSHDFHHSHRARVDGWRLRHADDRADRRRVGIGKRTRPTMLQPRPAIPLLPPRLGAVRARQDRFAGRIAMCITVVAALTGVLIVAAAAVALAIT